MITVKAFVSLCNVDRNTVETCTVDEDCTTKELFRLVFGDLYGSKQFRIRMSKDDSISDSVLFAHRPSAKQKLEDDDRILFQQLY